MAGNPIFGIDLGTTYSCIAYVDEAGRPVAIPNSEGDLTTPSVVYFECQENVVVGKVAKNTAKIFPDRAVAFVKRQMGNPSFAFEVDDRAWRPEEVSSLILRKLVKDATTSGQIREPITDVVITCPAYFGITQREATKNAGILAGLKVHMILNEPTAAAICYGMERYEDKVVLIYDLGGGTFDISVIAIGSGGIQVVVTGGNAALGGKDWDDRLVAYLAEQFMAQHPDRGDPRDDLISLQDLCNDSEEIKKGLSSRDRYPIMVSHAGERARIEVTREKFEELVEDLLEQTIDMTRKLLAQAADRGFAEIDHLLLVGGSSKMPAVRARLEQAFGLDIQLYDPDQSVAKGAALMGLKIQAGEDIKKLLAEQTRKNVAEIDLAEVDEQSLQQAAATVIASSGGMYRLGFRDLARLARRSVVNVSSKAFGVKVVLDDEGRQFEVRHLIQNNTPVPVETTQTNFGTLRDNQDAVHIEVMQQAGESPSPIPENNDLIVEGDLPLPPGLPSGAPIHITFRLAEDGTLDVLGIEPKSGNRLPLQAKVTGVMSEEEVTESKRTLLKVTV